MYAPTLSGRGVRRYEQRASGYAVRYEGTLCPTLCPTSLPTTHPRLFGISYAAPYYISSVLFPTESPTLYPTISFM
eukprot:1244413-Rhodomonas_salina.1